MLQKTQDLRDRDGLTARKSQAAAAIFKKYWGSRRLGVRLLELFRRPLAWLSRKSAQENLGQVERILVFEPGSLGDMVMLMPFLKSLRMRFPQAHLALLCRASGKRGESYASLDTSSVETLLLDQGLVDELIPVSVPWLAHFSPWKKYIPFSPAWPAFVWNLLRLRRRAFDLSFPSGRSDVRYNLVLWLAGAKRRVGYGYAGAGILLTDVAVPDMARPYQTDVCLQLLKSLHIPAVRTGHVLKFSPQDDAFSMNFLQAHEIAADDLIVGIHAGSRVASRTWGQDRFRQVAERLAGQFGAKVIWFGAPVDSTQDAFAENIVSASFPLREFLAVLARCSLLVCNDSGAMHMAGALGVPAVAVFGSTFPEWFIPSGENHRFVAHRDIPSRPCGQHWLLDEPYCSRLISVEKVMQAVEKTLNHMSKNFQRAEGRW